MTLPMSTSARPMKIEFLLCGSPNDAFYSQTAMFRMALDSLGGIYRQARLSLCIGDETFQAVPARWREPLRNVDVLWAPREMFRDIGNGGDFRYEVLDAGCDLSLLCDADTLLLAPIEPERLRQMVEQPAIRGVIAHLPPPFTDAAGRDLRSLGPERFWQMLADQVLDGQTLALDHLHTLSTRPIACPFYINYGVLIGSFEPLRALYEQLRIVQPRIRQVLDNRFFAQLGLTLGCRAAGLATQALPMRYNFPNDPVADAMYPGELEQVRFMHYLRTKVFDRHQIFATAQAFDAFMRLELDGSNRVFQDHVRRITGGVYPFG